MCQTAGRFIKRQLPKTVFVVWIFLEISLSVINKDEGSLGPSYFTNGQCMFGKGVGESGQEHREWEPSVLDWAAGQMVEDGVLCQEKLTSSFQIWAGLQGYNRIFARVVEGLGKRTKESSCAWILGLGSLERLGAGLVETVTHRCQRVKDTVEQQLAASQACEVCIYGQR